MSRTPLTLIVGIVIVALSLYAAWVQCQNFAIAGELDSITKDSAWLERCIGEKQGQLAELTFEANRENKEARKPEPELEAPDV